MKASAKAPANIAFIKYWGKRNKLLRIPMNNSISMNLSNVFTTTKVEFKQKLGEDLVRIDGKTVSGKEKERVVKHLNRVRRLAKVRLKAKVESRNNFPKGTGLASSASGFAALTLAASKAAGLNLTEKQLSILARIGSGSACRSIPDGFVEWKAGKTNELSYAYSFHPSDYWDICDVIALVGQKSKEVSSTEGHALVGSSPFFKTRVNGMKKKVDEIKTAMKEKDFSKFGKILEEEAINMHSVMMTSRPALFYWTPETMKIILSVLKWRDKGLESYFTIDAGPNVHIICQEKNVRKIGNQLSRMSGIKKVMINRASIGTHLI